MRSARRNEDDGCQIVEATGLVHHAGACEGRSPRAWMADGVGRWLTVVGSHELAAKRPAFRRQLFETAS